MEAFRATVEHGGRRTSIARRGTVDATLVALLVLALLALTAAPVPAAAKRVHDAPASIAHDCSVDVTDQLTAWIQKVPNNSTLKFARGGCYRIDGSLTVSNRTGLTFDGNGATFQAMTDGDQNRRHFWFSGGKNLVVRNLTVRGANQHAGAFKDGYVPARAFQHAFSFNGVVNARLDNVQAYNVSGDFVYIGNGGPKKRWSSNIQVTNSHFEGSGRQGLSITAGKHILFEGNEMSGVPRSMFDLESNNASGGAVDVQIVNNITGAAVNFWLANKGVGTNIRNIVFNGNRMSAATGGLVFIYGPTDGYRGPFVFKNNTLLVSGKVHDEGSRGAFFLSRATDVTIRHNVADFPYGRGVPAVEIQDSVNVQVDANVFTNAGPLTIQTTRPPRT